MGDAWPEAWAPSWKFAHAGPSCGAAPAKQQQLKRQGIFVGHVYDTWVDNVERDPIKWKGVAERHMHTA